MSGRTLDLVLRHPSPASWAPPGLRRPRHGFEQVVTPVSVPMRGEDAFLPLPQGDGAARWPEIRGLHEHEGGLWRPLRRRDGGDWVPIGPRELAAALADEGVELWHFHAFGGEPPLATWSKDPLGLKGGRESSRGTAVDPARLSRSESGRSAAIARDWAAGNLRVAGGQAWHRVSPVALRDGGPASPFLVRLAPSVDPFGSPPRHPYRMPDGDRGTALAACVSARDGCLPERLLDADADLALLARQLPHLAHGAIARSPEAVEAIGPERLDRLELSARRGAAGLVPPSDRAETLEETAACIEAACAARRRHEPFSRLRHFAAYARAEVVSRLRADPEEDIAALGDLRP